MEAQVKSIINGDAKNVENTLNDFVKEISQVFSFPELDKSDLRKSLWETLYSYLKDDQATHLHELSLSCIRILSRDKTNLNDIINEDLLNVINNHAGLNEEKKFDDPQIYKIAIEALKCLCNLIYQSKIAAGITSKNGTLEAVVNRIKNGTDTELPGEIKFFDVKILFLLTALCPNLRLTLKELDGITIMSTILNSVLKNFTQNKVEQLSENQIDFVCEILKLLFNLTMRIGEEPEYLELVSTLTTYLSIKIDDAAKRNELHNHIINLLTNMPVGCLKALAISIQDEGNREYQYHDKNFVAVHAILEFLMNQFSGDPTVSHQHEVLSPVLSVLLKTAASDRLLRKYLRTQILPPLKDVHTRPEEGNALRNYMCRLLTSPITPVRDIAAELLFVLCKENVQRMIKYTGYGNAAGLFANRGLLGGKNGDVDMYSSDSCDSDTDEYKEHKHGINPVIGCFETPHPSATANMTEEQKEYEAMKLVELMDCLTKTGIVKPCRIGKDGKPEPVEHILQLQEGLKAQQLHQDDESD